MLLLLVVMSSLLASRTDDDQHIMGFIGSVEDVFLELFLFVCVYRKFVIYVFVIGR